MKNIVRALRSFRHFAIGSNTAASFHRLSDSFLEDLSQKLEEESQKHKELDTEYHSGVLTISINRKDNPTFVINKQAPALQIWSSSPLSGPKRYGYAVNDWVNIKDPDDSLSKSLERELSSILGKTIKLT